MPTDKIKRAITWIRKSLEITEKTTNPGTVDGNILPTIDTFGWSRLGADVRFEETSATATNRVLGSAVPVDVLRLVLEASVEHGDTLVDHTLWIDHEHGASSNAIAIQSPFEAIASLAGNPVQVGLMRHVVMREGDRLSGRATPVLGVGLTLRIVITFVEIPIGEYVPPL